MVPSPGEYKICSSLFLPKCLLVLNLLSSCFLEGAEMLMESWRQAFDLSSAHDDKWDVLILV